MRNYLTFGGLDSRDYGVYISGSGVFNAPERQYEMISIPGRSGDLVGIERRLANIELVYPAFIYADFKKQIAALNSAFLAKEGYQQLIDTYYPDEYRMALFAGGTEVDSVSDRRAGQFELKFQCKPQRYLLEGAEQVDITSSLKLINPTAFDSSPLIRVYGYGDLGINSMTVTIANQFSYVDIDSEMMDCYSGTNNANPYVSFSGNDFPTLRPGTNNFTKTSNITQIKIVPRWWHV